MRLPPELKPFDSEFTVLGAAISGQRWASELVHKLGPEHFSEDIHARMWSYIQVCTARGHACDAALLHERLKSDPAMVEMGGMAFLADLIDKTPVWSSAEHAEVLVDRSLRRQALALWEGAAAGIATDVERPAFDHLTEIERGIGALVQTASPAETYVVDAQAAAFATIDRLDREAEVGKPRGLMTGLRCFDMRLRGLRPGWLVIIAGRPGMAKSGVARSTALAAAFRNPDRLFVFFALEMDRDELSERTLSELTWQRWGDPIPYKDMDGPKIAPEDRERLRRLALEIPSNFILDDSPMLSVEYVRRRLHALKARGRLGAVFIDYLQIMKRPPANGRNEASVIQDITQALKQLARELEVCIVLLSQLNRGVESRDDKRPQLADLRESGAIEQDANAVLALYRPIYYLERAEPRRDGTSKKDDEYRKWEEECEVSRRRLDVITLKVRAGAAGTDRQAYFAECDHVEDVRDA